MKNLLNGAKRRNRFSFAILLPALILLSSCQKNANLSGREQEQSVEANVFRSSQHLASETIWQLQEAKIATAKYNNFENARKDNYVDINVVVPEMGYHYLKVDYLNATFEHTKPEILVYNKEENGRMKLVALEYATPVTPDPPAGFPGNNDVWSVYQGQLWTLHAWVWEYNPAGIFNSTNPSIHVH